MNINLLISQFIPQSLKFAQRSSLWAQKSSNDNSRISCLYLLDCFAILRITGERPRRPLAVCLLIPRRCLPKNNVDDLGEGYGFDRIQCGSRRQILNDSGGIYGGHGGAKHHGMSGSADFCPRSTKGSEVEQLSEFYEAPEHFCSGYSEPET